MSNSPRTLPAALFAAVLAIAICWNDSSAFMQRKDKTTILEVPTTGQILDVNYRPEFDEWWIHCREGDNIAVYTYDYRNRIWGKVLFTPKRPDDKAKTQLDRNKEPEKQGATTEPPIPQEQQKPDQKIEKKEDKDLQKERKWWNPLKLLTPPDRRNQGKEPTPGSY